MQIVIDIPEEFYEYCKSQEDAIEIQLAVKNGTPLPKGHGRLIDANKFEDWIKNQSGDRLMAEYYLEALANQHTVLERGYDEENFD